MLLNKYYFFKTHNIYLFNDSQHNLKYTFLLFFLYFLKVSINLFADVLLHGR